MLTEQPRITPRQTRRRRTFTALGVVAVLGTGAGVAAATDLFARTGQPGSGSGEEDASEQIRVDAPDAPDVVRELGDEIPLPPGISFDDIIELPDEPTTQTELGLQSTLEFEAGCQWTTYWIASHEAGDETSAATAQSVLDAVPNWPARVATDDGGVAEMWQNIADAARNGDVAGVNDAGYLVNCTDVVPGR